MAVRPRVALFAAPTLAFALLFAVGCGGGGSSSSTVVQSSSAISIALITSPSTVAAGSQAYFSASVMGTTNQSVTWQVNGTTGGNSAVGTISNTGVYVAPTTIPSPSSVTVKAIAQADTTKSASAPLSITIGLTPSAASVLVGQQQQFTANGASVNWFLSGSGANLGTIVPSGPNTATYTAPNGIPDPPVVTVTAKSQSNASVTASASCTINSGGTGVNQGLQTGPIKLGTSGGNITDNTARFCCSGTLGALLTRSGTQYVLSNNHVLAKSDQGKTGDSVSQPGLVDTNCNPGQTVASLSQFVKLETGTATGKPPTYIGVADAAIAQVVPGKVDPTGAILQLGPVSGGLAQPAPPSSTIGTATVGMQVAKSGRTTGLTCSTVSAVNLQVQIDYSPSCGSNATAFTVTYNNQVDMVSSSFSNAGDSGSLIVDANTARPVALLYGGSPTDTVANPISDVINALADPKTHVLPQFVGGPDHTVSACTGNGSQPGPGLGLTAATIFQVADDEMLRASAAKATYADQLMSDPAVFGVGITAGDVPGQSAVMVLVEQGKPHRPIPTTLNGVPVKVRYGQRIRAFSGACSSQASASWQMPR